MRFSEILKGNVYLVLLYRLAVVMLLFSLSRLAFLFYHYDLFADLNSADRLWPLFFGGLRFDLTATLYTNGLYVLLQLLPFPFRHRKGYQRVADGVFFLFNGLALAMNTADFAYFPFTLRRTTSSVFSEFAAEGHLPAMLGRFLFVDYPGLTLFWAMLMALMVLLYYRMRVRTQPAIANIWAYVLSALLLSGGSVYLYISGARGGFRHSTRPITLSNAGEYVRKPNEMAIVLNTPFSIFRTINKKSLKRVDYYKDEAALQAQFTPLHQPAWPDSLPMQRKNVVVIILESFGKEYSGALNPQLNGGRYQGYTPFLDSLMKQGRVFVNAFANGRKSIDALPSVAGSIPAFVHPFVLSHYSSNRMQGMASLLKAEGYQTAFFHGAPNGSMGFGAFMNLAGYERYHGKDEYGNDADYDGIWGIWDEPFMQYYARQMGQMRQPFATTLFSVSSHHPFNLPAPYDGKLQPGPLEIHRCIRYTDIALRRFFEAASKQPWYANTLFVITADHCSTPFFPEYKTPAGAFKVPILLFDPSDASLVGVDSTVVQQTDIMPTVLTRLRYRRPYVAFGQDMLDPSRPHYAFNYLEGVYQLIEGDHILLYNEEQRKVVGLFDYQRDRLMKQDLSQRDPQRRERMLARLKAVIQQYSNRMLDDCLTPDCGKQVAGVQ